MKVGIAGGLLFGGLVAAALLGAVGSILLIIGAGYASWELVKERRAEKQAARIYQNYPKYGY